MGSGHVVDVFSAEQTPAIRVTTHARMLILMALLGTVDITFLFHALSVSVQVSALRGAARQPCFK